MDTPVDKLTTSPVKTVSVNPKRFILWLFIVTIIMLFAALTSAYVVRKSAGNWVYFDLPTMFWITSAIIIASSLAVEWAYWNAKKGNLPLVSMALFGALLLGFTFLVGQYMSWIQLVDHHVFFVGNPSGSFLYVLTGVHAFHLLTGIIFLIIVLISSLRKKIKPHKLLSLQLFRIYWHFLGILWIYLFIFLLFNH
jgi:cytochrome c oxidase subunit 3